MELNPQHPVTQATHDQWHKLAALLVHKLGGKAVITCEEIESLQNQCIIVHAKESTIELELLTLEEGAMLASQGSDLTH